MGTKKEAIIEYFSKMDIEMLQLILDDSKTYQDATKETFLGKLDEVFTRFKKLNDTFLKPNYGKCLNDSCNKGCRGYSFVGNISKNHADFVFEESETDFKDIYHCSDFKNDNPDLNLREEIPLYINRDEKANFKPSIEYLATIQKCENAYKELINDDITCLSKENCLYWLEKHIEIYDLLDPFMLLGKTSKFNWLYYRLKNIYDYLKFESEAGQAVRQFTTMDVSTEEVLLKWLVKFEKLGDELILLFLDEEDELKSGWVKLSDDYNIRIAVSDFKWLIKFKEIFNKHYYEMLEKYTTIKDGDWSKLVDGTEESDNRSSLTYHLKKRKKI